MLPGLCRTKNALLLQTCPILDESLAWVGTLISMLNLGVWDPAQQFEDWGLGRQAPIMRGGG